MSGAQLISRFDALLADLDGVVYKGPHAIPGAVESLQRLDGIGVGLGYEWTSFRSGSDDRALWGANAGVEIPAGRVTITPRIIYADDFESSRKSGQDWTYQVEANYWFDTKTAVFGSIGKTDISHSSSDSWNYRIGLRARF